MTRIDASRGFLAAVLACAATVALAQTSVSPQAEEPDEPVTVTNAIGFVFEPPSPAERAVRASAERTQSLEEIARLKDPQQRAALRDGERVNVRRFYPELAEVLGIDADLEQKLVTLLAEQRLDEQLRGNQQRLAYLDGRTDAYDDNRQVAVHDRERAALKALLGPPVFGRYLAYQSTALERFRVADFDAQLGDQRLTRQQKDELTALLAERERERRRQRSDNPTGVYPAESFGLGPNATRAELNRYNLLANVRLQERMVAIETRLQRQLLEGSSKFLNSFQQAAFTQRERRNLSATRQSLRSLRQQAGLDPEQALDSVYPGSPRPQPLQRSLQWAVRLRVNQSATQEVSFTTRPGQPVTFQAAEGLSVEAVATPYDNGRVHVRLTVFEQNETGRYRLGELDGSGPLQAAPDRAAKDSAAQGVLSTSGTTLVGSKGYELGLSVFGTLR